MIRLVLALCVALALGFVIVQELDDNRFAPSYITPTSTPPVVKTPLAPQLNAEEQAAQRQRWLQTILARPLFEQTRRRPGAGQASAAPSAVLPRLAGVLVTPAGRKVLFAGDEGKPIVLDEGAHIGEFTVQAIAAGRVTVLGPDGTHVLHPRFDPDRQPVAQANTLRPSVPGGAGASVGAGIIVNYPLAGLAQPGKNGNFNNASQPLIANTLRGRPGLPQAGNAAPNAGQGTQ